jgi:type IV secretory pathway ATPase VirB11/archaellum biosynthesis ATPase
MLEIGKLRWPDDPEVSGEHEIVGVYVQLPPRNDPDDDDRFAIMFQTATGRTLRVRLPVAELERLARCLLDAAADRDQYPL